MSTTKPLIPIIHVQNDVSLNNNNNQKTNNKSPSNESNRVSPKFRLLCIVYGLFNSLVGVVLATTEPFKACGECGGSIKLAVNSYLIYLYYVSIVWFVYMFFNISLAKRNNKISIKYHNGFSRRLSYLIRSKENMFDSGITINAKTKHEHLQVPTIDDDSHTHHSEIAINDLSNYKYTYDFDNGTGELYMRVGTGVLSICTMVDVGLNMVKHLESYRNENPYITNCMHDFVISLIVEIGAFSFTFTQCFFIFKHANIVINQDKSLAILGLCHLVCTNFVVTLRNIILETVTEIDHHSHSSRKTGKTLVDLTSFLHPNFNFSKATLNLSNKLNQMHEQNKITRVSSLGCWSSRETDSHYVSQGIQYTQDKLAPYLFPCIIEYSLMCLTVFYIIWENIDKHTNVTPSGTHLNANGCSRHSQASSEERLNQQAKSARAKSYFRRLSLSERLHVNKFTVDCGKSATGLFIGLFILLATIISLIVYFIYKEEHKDLAVQISEYTELILVILSIIMCACAFCQLKKFGFQSHEANMNYNETLMVVALAGIYLFSLYSILAIIAKGITQLSQAVTLILHVFCLIEATLQCIFILDALRRKAIDLKTRKEKPARSLVTLLILINLSLWLSETFSVKKYDMNTTQLDYYKIIFWSIASSIATPLAIFYRFHSSVCLSDIWKNLYQ